MTRFLRNAWYVAAWDEELNEQLLPRTLLNERVLLFRDSSGVAKAISNICPHRFAQLHMGMKIGDAVECGYHGLRFDGSGACVHNPHGNGAIPAAARVRAFPAVERHGAIWLWMGDPVRADAGAIPDYSHVNDPSLRTIRGSKMMRANYLLLVDNLMDASHSQFVHSSLLATPAFLDGKLQLKQEESCVDVNIFAPAGPVPGSYRSYLDPSITEVDMWVDFHWDAPSALRNRTGITPAGQPRSEGAEKQGTHFVTPETDGTSHYFYAHSRSFKRDDRAVDEAISTWQRIAFSEQDAPMIEGCQEVIGDRELEELKPVMLVSDIGVVRVRRLLSAMIEREQMDIAVVADAAQSATPAVAVAG